MAKRFTLMIIPEDGEGTRRFKLRRSLVSAFFAALLLLVGVTSFLGYSLYSIHFKQDELNRLRQLNSRQRTDLQRLTADVEQMRTELAELAETEARVRQLASLDDSPQALPVAIGGLVEAGADRAVDQIQQRINQLQVAIELRRQSQEEVRNLLNDQVSISRATPKGWPTKGWITSYFGMRKIPNGVGRRMHEGLDIAANTGTPVYATADGIVARVGYWKSYGKAVVIDHGYGYRTLYAHNSRISVKRGQRVRRGDKISEVGNTGSSTGPHVHYEVQLNGVPINPRKTL